MDLTQQQGTLIKAAQFLSEELPIRLSHRVVELESLPDGLSKMPSINRVKEWYAESFQVSSDCRPTLCDTSHHASRRVCACISMCLVLGAPLTYRNS